MNLFKIIKLKRNYLYSAKHTISFPNLNEKVTDKLLINNYIGISIN